VTRQLGSTSLFAAHFRQNAARALLLPRRRPGVRTPLWQQRKRSADLLNVAARYPSFPMMLETYRECMRDIFDLSALTALLRRIESGTVRVATVDSERPSPFAASLLFGYVANYIYDGDAPLAERRAQALSIDQSQLQELLGDADYRELLDPAVLREVEDQLQCLGASHAARHADAIHDLLLRLGDLSAEELRLRCDSEEVFAGIDSLMRTRRVLPLVVASEERYIAVEYASQYRDAFGVRLPEDLPAAWLAERPEPLLEVLSRYARTHGPFTHDDLWRRYRLPKAAAETALAELVRKGRLLEGEFRPGGGHREWVHPDVLQQLRRRTLARLRREVEPLEARMLGVFLPRWQGVGNARRGGDEKSGATLDALLDSIETLQGVALPLSEWEREILPARIRDYNPASLDTAMAAGEVVWVGHGALGERDGRLALYLAESLPALLPPPELQPLPTLEGRAQTITEFLARQGASFFTALHQAAGGGFPGDTRDALWQLAWQGVVTNDTFHSLRNFLGPGRLGPGREREGRASRQRSDLTPPGSPEFLRQFRARSRGGAIAQGRWSLVRSRTDREINFTEWSASVAQQLLLRYGLVTRASAAAEELPGGFSALYPALCQMEDRGRIRRGLFISGLGGSQFAMNAAVEALRGLREWVVPRAILLAAVDPANPYGTLLPWPRLPLPQLPEGGEAAPASHGMARTSGASVLLVAGELVGYLRRGNPSLKLFLPASQPERDSYARAAAHELAQLALRRQVEHSGVLISEINAIPAREHDFGEFLAEAGFVLTPLGYQMRRARSSQLESEAEFEGEAT
jgi:ATP-dependent Lhr-like helicase